MTFDEQLRRAFETLTDRLRDDIAAALTAAADELAVSAAAERDAHAADAAARARAEAERDAADRLADAERTAAARVAAADQGAAEAVAAAEARAREAVEAAHASAAAHAAESSSDDDVSRLVDAVRAIDAAPSATEVLTTLADRAAADASRVALLLARGGRLRGFRTAGFDPSLDGSVDVAIADGGVAAEAVTRGEAVSGSAAPPFAMLPEGRQAFAAPIVLSGQVVAILYADEGSSDDAPRTARPGWPSMLEVMTRLASRRLEALTAFVAARAVLAGSTAERASADAATRSPEEEDESARRYARLLVSEIKLYHEAEVAAGRAQRDLGTRLASEIARARGLYEQRVPAAVRSHGDFFQAELVQTLADGDPATLGT